MGLASEGEGEKEEERERERNETEEMRSEIPKEQGPMDRRCLWPLQ